MGYQQVFALDRWTPQVEMDQALRLAVHQEVEDPAIEGKKAKDKKAHGRVKQRQRMMLSR